MRTLNNTEIASVNGGFFCLFGLFFFKPAFSFSLPAVCFPKPTVTVCPQPAPQPTPCGPAPRPSRGGC